MTAINTFGANGLLSQFGSMVHDGVGNVTSLAASLPAAPTSYSGTSSYRYDNKDQLTQEQSTRNNSYTNNFVYDNGATVGAGNPTTSRSVSGNTYNIDNQITNSGFSYDGNGNGNPTLYKNTALTFDPENRMTSYGAALTAGYTGDDLRAWKQPSGGSKTYYLYDGVTPVCELDPPAM